MSENKATITATCQALTLVPRPTVVKGSLQLLAHVHMEEEKGKTYSDSGTSIVGTLCACLVQKHGG